MCRALALSLLLGLSACHLLLPVGSSPGDASSSGDRPLVTERDGAVPRDSPFAVEEGRSRPGEDRLAGDLPLQRSTAAAAAKLSFSQVSVAGGTLVVTVGWNGSQVVPTVSFAGTPIVDKTTIAPPNGLGGGVWSVPTPAAVTGTVEVSFPATTAIVARSLVLPGLRVGTGGTTSWDNGSPSTTINLATPGACPLLITVVTVLKQPTVLTPSPPQSPVGAPLGVGPITVGTSRWESVPIASAATWTQSSNASWRGVTSCLK